MDHMGDHNMPAGLHADWNDCLRLGAKGESTFVAFQLYYAINVLRKYAERKNDTEKTPNRHGPATAPKLRKEVHP